MATPVPIEDIPDSSPAMVPDSDIPEKWGVGDTARSVGAVLGGFAAMPVSGLVGLEEGIRTRNMGKTEKAMNYITSLPQKLLTTEKQEKVTENVGKVLAWPFQKAGAGYAGLTELASTGDLEKAVDVIEGKSSGSNILVPTAKIAGEVIAMGAMAGLGKKKGKVIEKPEIREVPVEDIPVELAKPAETPVEPIKMAPTIVSDALSKEGVTNESTPIAKMIPDATSESRLAVRAEADAIEAKLTSDFGNLAEYKTMNMKDQAAKASAILDGDYEAAKNMAMGKELPPEGVREATIYEAVKIRAIKEGDVETLHKLATESTVPTKLSEYGQAIKAADSRLMDDPVKVMQDIANTRMERAKRLTGQAPDIEKQTVEIQRLSSELEATRKALDERVTTAIEKSKKATYGSSNRIINQARYEQAKTEIGDYFKSTTLRAGIDPTILEKIGEVGVYHFEAGIREFGAWSNKMIQEAGEQIKPYLDDLWQQAQKRISEERSLRSMKTRWTNETQKLTDKLNNQDFAKKEKRIIALDPEAKRLKEAYNTAKENYNAATKKLGTVTKEEATEIIRLSSDASKLKENFNEETEQWTTPQDGAEYGASRVVYDDYVDFLKGHDESISGIIKEKWQETKTTWEKDKPKAIHNLMVDTIKTISDNSIAFVASVDDSFIGRQGLNTLVTHPTVWYDMAKKSFTDIYKTLASKNGGKAVRDALMADAYSRPNYLNGNYTKAKLIPKTEEQFPTSLPERIPFLGRVFKASENAFLNSAVRARINTFDLVYDIAKKNGVDVTDKTTIQDMGKLINSVTARGDLGRFGDGGFTRLLLWAPKMLMGNIDVLTAHVGGIRLQTSFARKQAAINLVKIVSSTAAVAAIANAIKPETVEINPLATDFMRIKVNNTRYDITGGKGSLVTLLARAVTMSRKTQSGKIVPLNSGKYGASTAFDVGIDFLVNKTTPLAGVAVHRLRGKNFDFTKPTLGKDIYGLTTPISIQNFVQNFYGPDPNNDVAAVVGSVVDIIGINSTTYDSTKKYKGGSQ